MRKAIKLKGKTVNAWRLGDGTPTETALLAEGKIKLLSDGSYELFSREAVNGSGERASAGDYFKVDSAGFPYPNDREYFISNHRHIEGDLYEQIPKPLYAWTRNDGRCEEIDYLVKHKGLVIDETSREKYFTAPLWGCIESAPGDAVVVFYSIDRDEKGSITDASFNFVAKDAFDKDYEWM